MSRPLMFKSKIDFWILFAILTVVAIAVLAVDRISSIEAGYGWVLAAAVTILGVLLPLWILTYTRYTLDEHNLTVHCGPFRWTVPIAEIKDVSATRSASKSPALSTRRLRLVYGEGRTLMISPDNREIFLRSLEARGADLGAESPATS